MVVMHHRSTQALDGIVLEIPTYLLDLCDLGLTLLSLLLLTLALLQKSLWDKDLVRGRGASISNISLVSRILSVWRRAPSGNCSYSAAFSQKANSTVIILIGENFNGAH
jgi:hypothetical protein